MLEMSTNPHNLLCHINSTVCIWLHMTLSYTIMEKDYLWICGKILIGILQGISYWNLFYELTLTDRNMQARFYLKVLLKSWGLDIWVSSTNFQKSNIGWPQQPPTEIGPKIWHDTSWFYYFFFLSKHQN